MICSSERDKEDLEYLQAVSDKLRKHQLKMDPLKCTFGATSGKFLGFVVGNWDRPEKSRGYPGTPFIKKSFRSLQATGPRIYMKIHLEPI